jgi:hypothetical protein
VIHDTQAIHMRWILITISLFLACGAMAQQGTLEVVGKHPGGAGVVRWSDPAALGQKKTEELTYADVEGTPFWDDHWNPAYLVLRNNSSVKLKQVKLNIFTGQVHYIDSMGQELVADPAQVPRLIFMKAKDTNQILAHFEAYPSLFEGSKLFYYRVFSGDGKFRLMEIQQSFIKKSDFDPLQGKKESRFFIRSQYAIAEYAYLHPLAALDRDNILHELEAKAVDDRWLKENRNRLRNEPEVVGFLDYLNKKQ